MNILIILAEVILIILIFIIFRFLVATAFNLLPKFSIFKGNHKKLKILQRNITGLLLFICSLLCIFIIGANGFLIYQGKDLQEYTLKLINQIPAEFWGKLGRGIGKSIGLIIIAFFGIKLTSFLLKKASIKAQNITESIADDKSIDSFFTALNKRIKVGIWLWVVIACTQLLRIPKVVSEYQYIGLRIYLIIAVGLLIIKATDAIVDTIDALSVKYSSPDQILRFYDPLKHLIPFFKRCLELVIYGCILTLAIQQIKLIANFAGFGITVIEIIGIIFISRVVFQVICLLLEEFLLQNKNLTDLQKSRRLTLVPLFRSLLQYFTYFTAAISILYVLNINPTPILAGAGIVGIAVGLGAQTLINDIVCGFFILFENYYLVGDYIQTVKPEENVLEGIVEAIELRTTRIRHPNGQLYIIRNGEIGAITNYSKQYIFAVVEFHIPCNSNLTDIYQRVEEIGQELQANNPDILEPTFVDGIESIGESHLLLRTLTKMKGGKHLQIQRTLRKIYLDRFLEDGILLSTVQENSNN